MSPPRRKWTIILVPPHPGAHTRRYAINGGVARAITGTTLVALVVTGIWSIANATTLVATADQLAGAQRMVLSHHDSVHVLSARVLTEAAQLDSAPEMIMPVAGFVTSRFSRSRFHPLLQILRRHQGIDLSAPVGTDIVAPAPATVSFVGWRLGDGLTIELSHNGGVTTLFGHCRAAAVRVGQRVHAGQRIGTVGASGLATGPHVHFEVQLRGTPIDPLRYLAASHDSATAIAERLRGDDR